MKTQSRYGFSLSPVISIFGVDFSLSITTLLFIFP